MARLLDDADDTTAYDAVLDDDVEAFARARARLGLPRDGLVFTLFCSMFGSPTRYPSLYLHFHFNSAEKRVTVFSSDAPDGFREPRPRPG